MEVESEVVTRTKDEDMESMASSEADESGEWLDDDHDDDDDDEGEEEWEDADDGSSEEFEVVNKGADSHAPEELKLHLEDDPGTLDHTSAASPTQSVTSNSSSSKDSSSSSKNNNNDNDVVAALHDSTSSTTILATSTLKTKRKNPLDGSFHEKEFLCTISSSNHDSTDMSDSTNNMTTTTTTTSDQQQQQQLQVNIVDKEHNKSVLSSSITEIFKDAGELLLDLNTFLTELDNDKKTTTETIPEEEEESTTTDENNDTAAPPTTKLQRTPSQILVNQSGVQIQRGNSSRQLLLSANSKRFSDSGGPKNTDKHDATVAAATTTTDAMIRGSNKEQQAAAVMNILANPKVLKSLDVLNDEKVSQSSQELNDQETDFWLEVEQMESGEDDLAKELNSVSILDAEKSILLETNKDDPEEMIVNTPSTTVDETTTTAVATTENPSCHKKYDDDTSISDDGAGIEDAPSNEELDNLDGNAEIEQDEGEDGEHLEEDIDANDKEVKMEAFVIEKESSSPSSPTAIDEQESNTTDVPPPTQEVDEMNMEDKNSEASLDEEEPNNDDNDNDNDKETNGDIQDNEKDVDIDQKPRKSHKERMSAMMEALNDDDDDFKLLDHDLDGVNFDDTDVSPVVIIPRAQEEEAPPEDDEEWEEDDDGEEDAEWEEDGDDDKDDAEWEEDEEEKEVPYTPVVMPVQHSPQAKDENLLLEEEEWEEEDDDDDEDLEKGFIAPERVEECDEENPQSRSLEVEQTSTPKGQVKSMFWTNQRYNRYRGCGLIFLGIVLIVIGLLTQM